MPLVSSFVEMFWIYYMEAQLVALLSWSKKVSLSVCVCMVCLCIAWWWISYLSKVNPAISKITATPKL